MPPWRVTSPVHRRTNGAYIASRASIFEKKRGVRRRELAEQTQYVVCLTAGLRVMTIASLLAKQAAVVTPDVCGRCLAGPKLLI